MIVVIAIGGFTIMSFNLDEVSEKNTLLDTQSQLLIIELQNDIATNLDISDIDTQISNLTANNTNEGTPDFSREFRESKAETSSQANRIEKVTSIPNVVIKSLGIPINPMVSFILTLIGIVLGVVLILALYIAWKTGEVKNNN
jgi:hypothetical protein